MDREHSSIIENSTKLIENLIINSHVVSRLADKTAMEALMRVVKQEMSWEKPSDAPNPRKSKLLQPQPVPQG